MPDWGAMGATPSARVPTLPILVAVVAYVGGFVLVASLSFNPALLAAWAATGAAVAWGAARVAGREGERLLAGARPAEHDARLERIVSGIAADAGMTPPAVWTYDGAPLNAFVTIRSNGQGVMCLSSELARSCTLTELEAVVAHRSLQLLDGVPVPRWARFVPGWTKRTSPCEPARYDTRAAALTRYPPALAAAIRKCAPRDGHDRGLWFVPHAAGRCSQAARVEDVEDL